MSRMPLFALAAILTISVAACGQKSPAAPSPLPGAGVTIVGTVSAPVPSGLQVTIGGSSNTSQVDGAGQFTLSNVPSGTVDLRFGGAGVSASLVLTNLLANQNVTLVVTVGGTSATLESSRRVRGSDEEVEGRIESLTPPTTFVVAGRTVSTAGATSFSANGQSVGFDALVVGQRITVKGQATSGALVAVTVDILTPIPIGNLSLTGVISGFSGTRSAFQFTVAGTQIQGDDLTTFDAASQFNELGNGLTIQIAGAQRTGFVYATRVTITAVRTSFTGRIIAMNGTPPQLVLVLTTQTVIVGELTDVRRKGEAQSASTIDNGQTVDVTGRLMADGTVVASLLNILTDSPGGTFSMTGTITAVSGSCPQIHITMSSYTITGSSGTTFSGTACSSLAAGDKVEVTGVVQQDFSIVASSIKKI